MYLIRCHTKKVCQISVCLLFLTPQPGYATCSPVSIKSGDRFIPTRAGSNWSINFHYANVGHLSLWHLQLCTFCLCSLPHVFSCIHFVASIALHAILNQQFEPGCDVLIDLLYNLSYNKEMITGKKSTGWTRANIFNIFRAQISQLSVKHW